MSDILNFFIDRRTVSDIKIFFVEFANWLKWLLLNVKMWECSDWPTTLQVKILIQYFSHHKKPISICCPLQYTCGAAAEESKWHHVIYESTSFKVNEKKNERRQREKLNFVNWFVVHTMTWEWVSEQGVHEMAFFDSSAFFQHRSLQIQVDNVCWAIGRAAIYNRINWLCVCVYVHGHQLCVHEILSY